MTDANGAFLRYATRNIAHYTHSMALNISLARLELHPFA